MRLLVILLLGAVVGYLVYSQMADQGMFAKAAPVDLTGSVFRAEDLSAEVAKNPKKVQDLLKGRRILVSGTIQSLLVRGMDGTELDIQLSGLNNVRIVFSSDFRRLTRENTYRGSPRYKFTHEGNRILLYARRGGAYSFNKVLYSQGEEVSLQGTLQRVGSDSAVFLWDLAAK